MPEYPAEFLLAALVVTTLASGGLLGLWAATSRWHWFTRTMVVLGLLMPLLWRPIFEPFVTLVAEVTTIVLGVTIYRRNWPRWRFSIAEVLMGMVVVSVFAAGLARLPEMDFYLWRATIGLGVVAGCCTLLAAWLATSTSWMQLGYRMMGAGLTLVVLAFGWSFSEYTRLVFDVCERRCGAPHWCYHAFSEFLMNDLLAMFAEGFVNTVVLIALLGLPLLLWRWRARLPEVTRGGLLGASVTAIAAWPVAVAWELLTPMPIPSPTSEDNAYPDLVAIGSRQSVHNPITISKQAVSIADDDIELIRHCLNRPIEVTTHYRKEAWKLNYHNWDAIRGLVDAIAARGENARAIRSGDTALATTELLFDLANRLRDQGVGNDLALWAHIESQAVIDAYKILPQLTVDEQRDLEQRIIRCAAVQPSLANTFQRQCCYEEHATGWGGHLGHFLTRISGNFHYSPGYRYGYAVLPQRNNSYLRFRMVCSLLATDLLLREHFAMYGQWPQKLDELRAPERACIWQDPFSPQGEALVYHLEGNHFLLYSRWDDAQDDGGKLKKSIWNGSNGPIMNLEGDVSVEELMKATPAELDQLGY